MILFYYGTDGGRIWLAAHALIERYRAKHASTNLFLCDASEPGTFAQVERALKHRSFFSEPTFVALRGVFSTSSAAQVLATQLANGIIASDTGTVLCIYEYATKKQLTAAHRTLYRTLIEQSKEQTEFEPLSGNPLKAWMRSFCAERGCTISDSDAELLTHIAGSDSWTLMGEMAKLCAWQVSGRIGTDAVTALAVRSERTTDVFGLTDALATRDKRSILQELERQLNGGAEPHYLLAMYGFTVRNLLMVSDLAGRGMDASSIARKSGLHPFVARKTLAASRAYTPGTLETLHAWLAEADRKTKDGAWDAADALYDFVLSAV